LRHQGGAGAATVAITGQRLAVVIDPGGRPEIIDKAGNAILVCEHLRHGPGADNRRCDPLRGINTSTPVDAFELNKIPYGV
jgi:hypothetical protein